MADEYEQRYKAALDEAEAILLTATSGSESRASALMIGRGVRMGLKSGMDWRTILSQVERLLTPPSEPG